jgi:protein-tyrosine phosphatase
VSRLALHAVLLVVLVLLLLNALIYGSSLLLNHSSAARTELFPGVPKFVAVDDQLWRGAAPSQEGYAQLAERGVRTVVDLRAEDGLPDEAAYLAGLGIRLVHLPIRDGQLPTDTQIATFLAEVRRAPGRVFVHCGAGVGRTGAMVGSYLVLTGEDTASDAVIRNLAVGPPTLEQIAYVAHLDRADVDRPSWAVTVLSRVLDAPRRMWSRISA